MIRSLGIVAPRILEKINRMRNLLEHEFEPPDLHIVTDALDTVSIFVALVDATLGRFQVEVDLLVGDENQDINDRRLTLRFDMDDKSLLIGRLKECIPSNARDPDDMYDFIALEPGDNRFLQFLERLIRLMQ